MTGPENNFCIVKTDTTVAKECGISDYDTLLSLQQFQDVTRCPKKCHFISTRNLAKLQQILVYNVS